MRPPNWVLWIILIFVVWYTLRDPQGAANFVHSVLHALGVVGSSVTSGSN